MTKKNIQKKQREDKLSPVVSEVQEIINSLPEKDRKRVLWRCLAPYRKPYVRVPVKKSKKE